MSSVANATVTVTGKVGAGATITAQRFTGVSLISFFADKAVMRLTLDAQRHVDVDILADTTVTMTLATGVIALTVS